MVTPLTLDDLKNELGATEQRIERKIDHRFDRFEKHFDETMTSIRVTLDEVHEQVRDEHRREIKRVQDAVLAVARKTDTIDEVVNLLTA